jgi:hypothetical protein
LGIRNLCLILVKNGFEKTFAFVLTCQDYGGSVVPYSAAYMEIPMDATECKPALFVWNACKPAVGPDASRWRPPILTLKLI